MDLMKEGQSLLFHVADASCSTLEGCPEGTRLLDLRQLQRWLENALM